MENEVLLSVDDGEAATRSGCLSAFLWPPLSTVVFGGLLLFGLIRIPIHGNIEQTNAALSHVFTPQVLYWKDEIDQWAKENNLDPNLIATVMQIESCGDPLALSSAGAIGLFQVMPYHFTDDENPYAPNTNALRGLDYLQRSLEEFHGDVSMALAGYNGGIQGASRPQLEWAQETIDYQYWGENIYADARAGKENSATLEQWLATGGASLCAQAEQQEAFLH